MKLNEGYVINILHFPFNAVFSNIVRKQNDQKSKLINSLQGD